MLNKYLLGLGGALLATTSLTAGAQAGSVLNSAALAGQGGVKPTTALTSVKIGAQLFNGTSGYTSSTTLGSQNVFISLSNSYTQGLGPKIVITPTGANFSSNSLGGSSAASITLINQTGQTGTTITSTTSGTAANCSIGVLTNQIQITNCLTGSSSASFSGIGLSGLIYTAATGLGTAGNAITLGGAIVEQANPSNTYESITAATAVLSQNLVAYTTSNGTATVALGTGTTAYTSLSQTVSGNTSSGLTVVLAQISFTSTLSVDNTFTLLTTTSNLVGNMGVSVTSAALTDPAISNIRFLASDGTTAPTASGSTGTATFAASTLSAAKIYNAASTATNIVQIEYNGTTAITGGVAGTISYTFAPTALNGQALNSGNAVTATTSAVTRAGFSTQINSVQASTNTVVTSYIRITNGGSVAGVPVITVYNASTGAVQGTFTAASVPGLATLQLSAKDIETGASVTPTAGGSYNLVISGTLPNGYVQHVTGNPGNLFVDFSARRNSNTGTANSL
eukprot:TRINITY_DN80938_c0_g1_i1.p1 TRINITY_DN80938_c0_g1~~TRINITY_DN80938_c0_g1_i1.p1  ORF type:complete len:510 (-),score=93.86 TRINITY_DN80938_c0_g1_i1:51-1580(-)